MSALPRTVDAHLNGTCTRAADGRHCHCSLEYGHANTGRHYTCCVTDCGWSTDGEAAVAVTVEIGDEIRLAPATPTREALFARVTSTELVNAGTATAFYKIVTADGDSLLLRPTSPRWVRRAA